MTLKYYLGGIDNRYCLSTNGKIELISACQPQYIDTEDEAIALAFTHGLIVHSCIVRFYLADHHDRFRLAKTGHIEAANDCEPWYFLSEEAARSHPAIADGLTVFACPAAETIPGLPKGALCAEDVLARIDRRALREMALEVAKLCRR